MRGVGVQWLADVLRGAGLGVAEVDGWRTRGRDSAELRPRGVVAHHTAGPEGGGNMPSLNLLVRGRGDLPGPLCNLGLGRDGTYYVVAAGTANHAGKGGWRDYKGNQTVIGIEAENNGRQAWPEAQLEAYARGSAAMLRHLGLTAASWCRHAEWTSRKPDPHGIDGDGFRNRIAALMGQGLPPMPPIPAREPEGNRRRTLQRGVKGEDVAGWQKCVAITPDGSYGALTEAATRAFQKKLDLLPDGIVGPKSYKRMDDILTLVAAQMAEAKPKDRPRPVPDFPGFARRGDSGAVVTQIQERFAARGAAVTVDGDFGPQTEGTVRALQSEKAVAVDGIVGPTTWGLLWS
jgi:peptidoglycan hydrolase-like protein with peptidoglycan-binding domain